MRGSLFAVFKYIWPEVWVPLARSRKQPRLFFGEMVEALTPEPVVPEAPPRPGPENFTKSGSLRPAARQVVRRFEKEQKLFVKAKASRDDAIAGRGSEMYLRRFFLKDITEGQAVDILEKAYSSLEDQDDSEFVKSKYKDLIEDFLRKYNLPYDVYIMKIREDSRHLLICDSVAGATAKLMNRFELFSKSDDRLRKFYNKFEKAFHDLRLGATEERIENCLLSQFMLMEAVGIRVTNLPTTSFNAACNGIAWPHPILQEVAKKVYGIRGDRSGLAHAGSLKGDTRPLEFRDFVALTTIVSAITPALIHDMDVSYRSA